MKEEIPKIEELQRVIYIYTNGLQYEMLDVQNYIDNLKASGALMATRGYMQMKPVNWQKITPNEPKVGQLKQDKLLVKS